MPVQAVGGLTISQAIECPAHGAPLVVLGAPLVIDADDFKPAGDDLYGPERDLRRNPEDAVQAAEELGVPDEDAASRRSVRARRRWRWSCAKSRCPRSGRPTCCSQVGAVSVCGSDVHQAYGTHSWPVNIPVALGHEFGGTVAAAGREVKGFREGDRVVSETAAVICGACLMCRTGRYNLCPTRKGFGYGVNGAMAEYVKVPARCLHHVPDSLPFELACLTEPHSVAYNSMCGNATIRPGDASSCWGPGPSGCCARAWRRCRAPTR